MFEKLNKIIKNRSQILEGFINTILKNEDYEKIAEARLDICKTNVCGYYDPEGKSEEAIIKGQPACAACGCNLEVKVRCMTCVCGLETLNKIPLWVEMEKSND